MLGKGHKVEFDVQVPSHAPKLQVTEPVAPVLDEIPTSGVYLRRYHQTATLDDLEAFITATDAMFGKTANVPLQFSSSGITVGATRDL